MSDQPDTGSSKTGRVAGKVVVVTGAAQGQGAAEVVALAAEGALVVATDLHDDGAALLAAVPGGLGGEVADGRSPTPSRTP